MIDRSRIRCSRRPVAATIRHVLGTPRDGSEQVGTAQRDNRQNWPGRIARGASRMRADIPLALIDVVVVVAAYTILLGARFDFSVPSTFWDSFRVFLPVACVVQVFANLVWGAYGRTWRHASIDEARRLLAAGVTSGIVLVALFAWNDADPVPMSVLIAGPMAATFLMGLVRFQSRLFAVRRSGSARTGLRVAVVGSGAEAAAAVSGDAVEPTPRAGAGGHRRRRPAACATAPSTGFRSPGTSITSST